MLAKVASMISETNRFERSSPLQIFTTYVTKSSLVISPPPVPMFRSISHAGSGMVGVIYKKTCKMSK